MQFKHRSKEGRVRGAKRRGRTAIALTACALLGAALAGTAWGATSTWQEVWAQIEPLLSDPGTINDPDNPVDWTKLKSVPTAFADGKDDGVDRAGFGLKKNIYPNLEFAVDTTQVQRRVIGSCTSGYAVQSIGADGAVTCSATGTREYSISSADTGILCDHWCSEGHLTLNPGRYAVWAKIGGRAENLDSGIDFECRLDADGLTLDASHAGVPADGYGLTQATLPLQGVANLLAPADLALLCKETFSGAPHGVNMQLMAIRVG